MTSDHIHGLSLINCLRLLSVTLAVGLLFMMQLSCGSSKQESSHDRIVARLISTEQCENTIIIDLFEENQYIAHISSDVPANNNIKFSGSYQKGKVFIFLEDIVGNRIGLRLFRSAKNNQTWILNGMTEEQALSSGWLLDLNPSNEQKK